MAEVKHRLPGALKLREWRLTASSRTTQADMGARIGVDLPRYNAYENGRARPGVDHASAIEKITGIPVHLWATDAEVSVREWERESRRLDLLQEQLLAAAS